MASGTSVLADLGVPSQA